MASHVRSPPIHGQTGKGANTVRSVGQELSFNLLSGDTSGDGDGDGDAPSITADERKPRKSRKKNKKRKERGLGFDLDEKRSVVETATECSTVVENETGESGASIVAHVELRQRNASGGGGAGVESSAAAEISTGLWRPEETNGAASRPETNGRVPQRLETMGSLDWKRVIRDDPDLHPEASSVDRSPLKYFMGEICGGNALRSTISVGNEKKRQRVYNTMFHVPVRCERLIIAGFFFCLDSFLSLLTIMPARILMTIWRVLKTRQFQRPSAAELSDFGCFIVLVFGVTTLHKTDISLIYHIIRGQGTIKLYVVYNVLEIFDKLCQSFGEDVLQVLFNSAEGLANCSAENVTFELLRFIFDEAISVIAFNILSDLYLSILLSY
ncbi:uncharacterized protein M6B38_337635 [Iris pallida]|uniref:Protein POLLEN DEFECTIVE IN GUIDANCE 1 n=1 Tax=Iris pallida TaxID=29817 RepID=A0AAX6H0E8_IRIPA|nr:uncharacterized protein M6B38_337635 [Iris pallida]